MAAHGLRRVLKLLLFRLLENLKLSTFIWSGFVLLVLRVRFQKEVWLYEALHNCA